MVIKKRGKTEYLRVTMLFLNSISSSTADRLYKHWSTIFASSDFSFAFTGFSAPWQLNIFHMLVHSAHVPCKWNYSASHDKRSRDKKVDTHCSFIFNCQNSNQFPIHPPCALCMWVPKCVYIQHVRRGCDAWEARGDQHILLLCAKAGTQVVNLNP